MEVSITRPAESIRDAQDKDGAVLLDIAQGVCYGLNPVGARIWQLLKLNYSNEQIATTLAAEFSAQYEHILEDVLTFKAELGRKGLLITSNSAERRKLPWRLISAIRRLVSVKGPHADES